jgi:hypothetical protein
VKWVIQTRVQRSRSGTPSLRHRPCAGVIIRELRPATTPRPGRGLIREKETSGRQGQKNQNSKASSKLQKIKTFKKIKKIKTRGPDAAKRPARPDAEKRLAHKGQPKQPHPVAERFPAVCSKIRQKKKLHQAPRGVLAKKMASPQDAARRPGSYWFRKRKCGIVTKLISRGSRVGQGGGMVVQLRVS